MSKPKIRLSDELQEMIALNQENDNETAKHRVSILDKWMGTIISGHGIAGSSAEERMEILGILHEMKLDYQSFIVE